MTTDPFHLGAIRIDTLVDGIFEIGREVLIHEDGEEARALAMDAWGDRPLSFDVNVHLLRGPDGISLIDAGTGPHWGPHLGHARKAMSEAGVEPGDVDRILLTHVHGDHALGLLGEADAPYFPRAKILLPAAELAFFTNDAERLALPEKRRSGFEITARLIATYGDRLRPVPFGAITPEIELIALPGHTPGQGGYLLSQGDTKLLLWADALHLAQLQSSDPGAGLFFDLDPATAVRTRRTLLARAAAEGWIVGGSHLTGYARVIRDGGAFRLEPLAG
ncbi:AidB family quorum-quenching N-acyl homoserine lactonase [Roseococcus pinisoli]|uniref:MBL fold metallo-hydrolase n=1 Tax=Roseococcus pinisoli TaxID=2835040 RepID=A0ABS5QFN4_9PROT|nr:MBL fold metallo-hydrolase [Roseococcus pinisoli]MBS7812481.1 MBL fold metallo-hydrolase [Roseococcus pinisoli]